VTRMAHGGCWAKAPPFAACPILTSKNPENATPFSQLFAFDVLCLMFYLLSSELVTTVELDFQKT